MEIVDAADFLSREAEEEVALADSRASRGALLHHFDHEDRLRLRNVVEPREARHERHILAPHADMASPNPSILDETPRHVFDGVARDSEADPLRSQDDRRREPDDGA